MSARTVFLFLYVALVVPYRAVLGRLVKILMRSALAINGHLLRVRLP